jgi:hypothetical protein
MLRVEEHDRMSMVMDGRVLKEDAELGKLGVSSDTGGLVTSQSGARRMLQTSDGR